MAEDKHKTHKGPSISFGLEVVLFIVAIFAIWVLTGGAKKTTEDSPILDSTTENINPNIKYGNKEGNLNPNYQHNTTVESNTYKSTDTIQ